VALDQKLHEGFGPVSYGKPGNNQAPKEIDFW